MLPVSKADDGATIRCEAEHPALQEALSARKLLTIHCKQALLLFINSPPLSKFTGLKARKY